MTDESSAPAVIEMNAVPPAPVRTLSMVAAEIKTFSGAMLNNAIEIGRRMYEAKYMLPHGQFMAWAKANTGFSQSAVNNFMRLFDAYAPQQGCIFGAGAESGTISGLSMSQALALLALPADERETFAEEVDAENLSVRELQREIEEYQRKQKATQAALDAERNRSAELQRQIDNASTQDEIRWAKIREEERHKAESTQEVLITAAKDSAEQARKDVEKLRTALEKVKAERDKYKNSADEAAQKATEKAVAKMQAQLNKAEKRASDAEERAKQIELTQELNTKDLVESAKQEATAELREKLSKAEAALDEANKSARAASDAENKLRQELSEARNQTENSGTGKAVVQFELLFQQAVMTANQMRDIMLAARQTDAVTAGKLSGILEKLADEIRRCAT